MREDYQFDNISGYAEDLLLGQGLGAWGDAQYRNMGGEPETYKEIRIVPPPELGLSKSLVQALNDHAHAYSCGSHLMGGDGNMAIVAIPTEDYDLHVRPRILARAGVAALPCNAQPVTHLAR